MNLPVSAAVVVIVEQAGRVLLIEEERGDPRGPVWYFPSGAPEPGETLAETARREVSEETGYDVEPETLVALDHCAFQTPVGLPWSRSVIAARLRSTVPAPVEETNILRVEWVQPSAFAGLRWRSHDATHLLACARSGRGLPLSACRLSEDGTLAGFFA